MKTRVPLFFIPLLLMAVFVLAVFAGSDPNIFFTDNILSSGPTQNVTLMEQALLDRLNAASTSIDAAIYDFNRDSVKDALIAAHNRGVTVRVVTDDDAYVNPTYVPYYTALETAGITVVNDNRPSTIMHNKFFVIDGESVWSGSTNISDNGFTYNHNNSMLFVSSEIASIYQLEFEEMFTSGLFSIHKTDNTTHTLTYNGIPMEIYFSPTDGAMDELIAEVNAAQDNIVFSIFFMTDNNLRDALIAAHNRGVDVVGVWDLLGASNQFSDDEALCAAGIPIKIEDFGGKMHHKFMVIDAGGSAPRVITGSMNWSAAGGDDNDENTLIIHDADSAQAYLTHFQGLYDALDVETLCEVGEGNLLVFLPLVIRPFAAPTATQTSTSAPSPTNTPTATTTGNPTNTSTPTPTPTVGTQPSGDITIVEIFYDGTAQNEGDEYVAIRNDDTTPVQLENWTLEDAASHVFTFPNYLIQPGEECRIYTNENHSEWCGFNYMSGSPIWNNGGDTGTIRDSSSALIDSCTYTGGGSAANCE